MNRVDKVLDAFPGHTVASRLLKALFAALPGAPPYDPGLRLDHFVRGRSPSVGEAELSLARDLADNDPAIGDLLWMGSLMDKGDRGIAMVGGLFGAWRALSGAGDALENDPEQRKDAVLKAVGISYLGYRAFTGTMAERAAQLQESVAGKHLLAYYGAIDVALPFADNLLKAGASAFSELIGAGAAAQQERLASMAAGHDLGQAREMLTALMGQLQAATDSAARSVGPITQHIGPFLPGAINAADKAAGVIATGADLLDVYTVLAARLAAETAARRALVA